MRLFLLAKTLYFPNSRPPTRLPLSLFPFVEGLIANGREFFLVVSWNHGNRFNGHDQTKSFTSKAQSLSLPSTFRLAVLSLKRLLMGGHRGRVNRSGLPVRKKIKHFYLVKTGIWLLNLFQTGNPGIDRWSWMIKVKMVYPPMIKVEGSKAAACTVGQKRGKKNNALYRKKE